MDSSLTGAIHVGNVLKSCFGRLAFLYRNSSLLDFHSRKTLCASLIQPYLDYCSSSWYESLSMSLKSKCCGSLRELTADVMSATDLYELSWLSIRDPISYFKLIHLFKIKHDLCPLYLRSNIVSVSDTHSYRTQSSVLNFHVSKTLSNAPSTFAYSCVKLWNALPEHIKSIDSLPSFKRRLKRFMLSSYD